MPDTIGDENEVDCPWCQLPINLTDIRTDGCLKVGFEDLCPHCEQPWEITELYHHATVYVKKGKQGVR